MEYKNSYIKVVLFDFDGTLTKPESLDFSAIRRSIGCPPEQPVFEFIRGLPDPNEQARAFSELDRFETEGAANSEPNDGAEDIIPYLRSKGIRIGIISRNSRQSIDRALQNFKSINPSDFDLILSRNDPVGLKPSPDGILFAAKTLNVAIDRIMVLGDFLYDIQAGQAAGVVTVFLDNGFEQPTLPIESDYRISTLEELKSIIRMSTPLAAGKFPNDLLKDFFSQFPIDDPSLLIHPGIGEDTAAVDVSSEEILVLKSDPITFATDAIGEYAVMVNANDIVTSGARPRWFLTTLLFPCNTLASDIWRTMTELQTICEKWGISLCGGHTEITDAVNRPVITGMLAGTVLKRDLIDKRNMREDDEVLLTKAIAVEGTAIIAREFGDRLKNGMSEEEMESCKKFLSQISILREAEIACSIEGISAMHDVTEGGLATAVRELSIAGQHRISINMDQIPVFSQTEKITGLLGVDPMGLIGSGSLLICCRKSAASDLINKIREAGIRITRIGEVLESGRGISAIKEGKPVQWPLFEVDEITRLFS